MREKDWLWFNVCVGVVVGDFGVIELFFVLGGDFFRQLIQDEVVLLNRFSVFEVGYIIVYFVIRFKRDDMFVVFLISIEFNVNGFKRLFFYVFFDVVAEIRREIFFIFR